MEPHEMAEQALKIATEARATAQTVRTDHEVHIRECAVRYERLNEKAQDHSNGLEKISKKQDAQIGNIYRFLWKVAIGIISLLLVISGWQYMQAHNFEKVVNQAVQEMKK